MAQGLIYASHKVGEAACLVVGCHRGGKGAGLLRVSDLGAKAGVDGWVLDEVVDERGDEGGDAFESGGHKDDGFGADGFVGEGLWG